MDEFDEAVDVLFQAFYDYPVMRYVAADAGDDFDRQFRLLIGFFSLARVTTVVTGSGRFICRDASPRSPTLSDPAPKETRSSMQHGTGSGAS